MEGEPQVSEKLTPSEVSSFVVQPEPSEESTEVSTASMQSQIESREVPVTDSRELHEPQLQPRNLQYKQVGVVGENPVLSTDAVNFPLSPNPKYLEKLETISPEDSSLGRVIKLINVAGTDTALLSLLAKGIRTGLAHGTMDIIYRIGVGDKVREVLDNLDIAVGSLQRRVIVSDLIGKAINESGAKKVFSIAGGSCLLPIEGIYQSGKEGLRIVNVDRSEKANEKAQRTLSDINMKSNIGLALEFEQRDILKNGLNLSPSEGESEIIECTGFWEYINDEERGALLQKVSESMGNDDRFILTALVNNPQQHIFEAIKFKKLSPHNLEDLLEKVSKHFGNIDKVVLTPNGTYATLVLRK